MLVIGITGGTGCGKTTLLRAIARCGGFCIDCDAVYHELLRTSPALREDLRHAFGNVFLPDGSLDRRSLGAVVFHDNEKLALLDAISFRHVGLEVGRIIRHEAYVGTPMLGIDAIKLIEGGLSELCDVTVAVVAPTEERVRRIMERDGISESYARARIAAQQPERFFRQSCTYTLENCGTREEFEEKADRLVRQLLARTP